MSGDAKKDLRAEARSFSASLTNALAMKRRDPQSKSLLEKAQQLIDALLTDCSRPVSATPVPPPRPPRGGTGMGQLWVKLDELKRENDDLRRQRTRTSEDKVASPKSPKSPKFHAPTPGQLEAAMAELQRVKADNESLKAQVEKLQGIIKEHQTVNSNLRDDCKRSKAALEAAQKSAMRAREDTKKMEANLQAVKAENESLKQKCSQPCPTPPPKPVISSPKPRMRTDNRMTENISEKCRPSNIAVTYTTLESQEWVDAKESLEEVVDDEETITQFLCDVLMSSFQASSLVHQSVEKVISYILTHPTSAVRMVPDEQIPSLPADVEDVIGQRLRSSFEKINTAEIADLAKYHCSSNSHYSYWTNNAVQKYAHQCASVTWQMTIQKPPMKLQIADSRFDLNKHNLWWSCDQAKAKKVNYFIWPVLYDYEGGNLMVKGCVHAT